MLLDELNWKTWGLIFLIALGGAFELIKHLPASRGGWDLGFRSSTDVNDRPYAVRDNQTVNHRVRRPAPPTILPASRAALPRPSMPDMSKDQLAALVSEQNKKSPKKDALEQDINDFEVVIDPKTGKKVKRKKKKKVAKKDKKKDAADDKKIAENTTPDQNSDFDSNNNDIDAAVTHTIMTGELQPAPPADAPDKPADSAEDWVRKLLNRPNLAETNRFIDQFKKGQVTSDVYYRVVRLMIEDSRPEMKKLGIMAASQVSSPLSFQILAKVTQSEGATSEIGKVAAEALNSYADFARLEVLRKILSTSSTGYTTLTASEKLQMSVEKNLKPVAQSTATSTPPSQTVQARQVTAYRNFIPILTNLQKSTEQAIKDQATQTLALIENLTGTSVSGPPTTASASLD